MMEPFALEACQRPTDEVNAILQEVIHILVPHYEAAGLDPRLHVGIVHYTGLHDLWVEFDSLIDMKVIGEDFVLPHQHRGFSRHQLLKHSHVDSVRPQCSPYEIIGPVDDRHIQV